MAILSKACKPDNFESQNSLKLSFTNIRGLRSSFVDCESFLESNSPDILALCDTNLDDSIDSGNFSVRGYHPLIRKDSSTHMHGLAVYVKEGLPFAWDLSLENSADSYYIFLNNRIVDHLEKCGLFSDFQYGFRSSRSTADLLTVVSDRIARPFNRSGATQAVALDICKAFDRVWHAGLLHKLKSYGISGQIFGLISSFLSNRQLRIVLDGKSSQEYPVNAGVPQRSILGPTLFLLYINDLPDDVICNIAIYADDTTLYSKCDQASDLWQQLELASELESDL